MVENKNLSVGIFVSLALAIMVVFTIWITGKKGTEPVTRYSILIEDDVTGLMLGGPVFFLGVAVGEVTALTIVSGNPPGVLVDIEVLESTPVDSGTWATLAAQGITGVSVINLSNDPGTHGPVRQTPGYEHPLIPFRGSGFSAIISSAPAILEKIELLLDRAGGLLGDDNQQAFSDTLANVETITQQLADRESGLAELPASINTTLTEVRAAITDLRGMVADAGPGVTASLENVDRATASLAELAGRLDQWVSSNDEEMKAFIGEGLGQVPALISDIRHTMREIEKLVVEIRHEPSGMIYQAPDVAIPVEED